MFANKFVSRGLIGTKAFWLKNAQGPRRQLHVAYTQPTEKVSTGEKIFQGLFLTAAMWTYPFWVLYYIPEYQKEDRNSYTGK